MKFITSQYQLLLILIVLSIQSVTAQEAYTTNTNPVGLEYNILFNAKEHYQVTQSGNHAYANVQGLFDGNLAPHYTLTAPTASDPYSVLIEGLPNRHISTGAWVGWTTRYWGAVHFIIEGYNSYAPSGLGWKTLVDYSTEAYAGNKYMEKINVSGSYTKLRFTFIKGSGDNGRLGISELMFLHPEATVPYENLIGYLGNWKVTENNSLHTTKKVGIGVVEPAHKLDVALSGSNFRTFNYGAEVAVNTTGGWARSFRVLNDNDGNAVSFGGYSGSAFIAAGFNTGEDQIGHLNQKLTVKSNGNVGIGTTDPDMRLSIKTDNKYVSRFHSTNTDVAMAGIRLGKVTTAGVSYADLVNLENGFGIGAGYSGSNLPLNTQNTSDIAIFTTYNTKNVGIGTVNTGDWKLSVNGKVRAKEIKVETDWADFVFEKEYNLPTLEEVESHIQDNGHLQDIPSAKEVADNGILLGEMNSKLLQKIEELMLYTIEQNKQILSLQKRINSLEEIIDEK